VFQSPWNKIPQKNAVISMRYYIAYLFVPCSRGVNLKKYFLQMYKISSLGGT
jgi:hypothetical protein